MLADVRCGYNDLTLADIVILDKDDLQEIANIRVVVYNLSNSTDTRSCISKQSMTLGSPWIVLQPDDSLGHPVSRRSLSTNYRHTRCKLLAFLCAHFLDRQITIDHTEDVELLTLVFVYTLNLDIEECGRVDADTVCLLDELCEANFVSVLDLLPFLAERLVVDIVLNLVEKGKIPQKLVRTKLGSDQLREPGISLLEPAARRDTIRDIGELVCAEDVHEVLENGRLDEIRVKLSHPINLVRTNNYKMTQSEQPNHTTVRASTYQQGMPS